MSGVEKTDFGMMEALKNASQAVVTRKQRRPARGRNQRKKLEELEAPIPCIVCGKTLRAYENFEESGINHPSGGVEFTTSGHYGSAVIDGGPLIAINVCDPCLIDLRKKGWVLAYEPPMRQPRRRAAHWEEKINVIDD